MNLPELFARNKIVDSSPVECQSVADVQPFAVQIARCPVHAAWRPLDIVDRPPAFNAQHPWGADSGTGGHRHIALL